ncbi:hypothetical protein BH18ACT9_BH18ACT9_08840 [soil metagenome]
MRHTEFWKRMTEALGDSTYAKVWSDQQVIGALGSRTVQEALTAGESPKHVWRAVWETLELPPSLR